jgi:hypothetical protein
MGAHRALLQQYHIAARDAGEYRAQAESLQRDLDQACVAIGREPGFVFCCGRSNRGLSIYLNCIENGREPGFVSHRGHAEEECSWKIGATKHSESPRMLSIARRCCLRHRAALGAFVASTTKRLISGIMSLQAIQQHRMEVEQLKSTERDARAQLSQEVQAAEEKAIQLKNERDRCVFQQFS